MLPASCGTQFLRLEQFQSNIFDLKLKDSSNCKTLQNKISREKRDLSCHVRSFIHMRRNQRTCNPSLHWPAKVGSARNCLSIGERLEDPLGRDIPRRTGYDTYYISFAHRNSMHNCKIASYRICNASCVAFSMLFLCANVIFDLKIASYPLRSWSWLIFLC